MAKISPVKNWVKNLAGTVTGSIAVFLIQNYLGLTLNGSDIRPEQPGLPKPAVLKAEAHHLYERVIENTEQELSSKTTVTPTESHRLDPARAATYLNRAYAEGQQGRFDSMAADCTEAIELGCKSAVAYANRGWAYAKLGRYDLAVRDCDEAIRLDPGLSHAFATRSWALSRVSTVAHR
jgi:tetratricopeptide (TPR) repeat protein